MKDLLLLTPPFTQLNTPYPATAYLKGFLNTKDISAFQMDLGIEVILELFSKNGLKNIFEFVAKQKTRKSNSGNRMVSLQGEYLRTIDIVMAFLQGKNPSLARQICMENLLPEGNRFKQVVEPEFAFGTMGYQDFAKHLATMYLEDISDFIKTYVDPNFGFSRYAERLGRSANSFDELYAYLQQDLTYIDEITLRILNERLHTHQPKLVCISVPFPGNLYSAFRCGQFIKKHFPNIKVAMGGGFANTELRSLKDVRVFDFFDYITLDDGELPIEILISNLVDPSPTNPNHNLYKRTFLKEQNEVVYNDFSLRKDYVQAQVGTPDYGDLLLDQYISVIEIANPMHSLWSDGRWNKLTMAHGCYWGKCTFCDISLDYIKNYEPVAAKQLVDRIETLIEQTGERGFHFVDEAAPPALMRDMAIEILRRKLVVTWWTNIRFEKSFTLDLCRLLSASGCIAVSGGLEVASDRLLKLIDKGVTVEQVAQVTHAFTEADIQVHAYLMYGYPTQTIQETVDSLEMVRQLFEQEIINSGFWHQFALTAHSPVGMAPFDYGIVPSYNEITFANNDISFEDSTGIDHDQFSEGLKKSLYNFMHGMGFEMSLDEWFDFEIPESTIDPDYIYDCLEKMEPTEMKPSSKIIWLGGQPSIKKYKKTKKGKEITMFYLSIETKRNTSLLELPEDKASWLLEMLKKTSYRNETLTTYGALKTSFEEAFSDFTLYWYSNEMEELKYNGLLVL